ncbi:uncharacterized protein LOC122566926 isoform X2 [Bombus pyrosoma]|uniref:uncharacterized protein LOC122566926 isoform X2 n=1 Tax=Bombus pyrosoma TaxID=396416 RepID=UPI001CB8A998|nr:uncharacterized protein LOC122566926 isoform X2 [Bombus pyrosoma]XP_043580814.1 uncharacterized protein LOC122566926 isoform X2 [Bombus pyrosoma]XP_043580815.1 uncharacterized protein LOC122566926 isoform X2 [Bombus pyrosoma]XP_043580816.1 uncharacterized protein LOC122566926 isoform X2 [Bombus pyrosoma]XP_043580817.1 uncharacterized protein LOC122566926 isoform X2 [Bombus pyrosoma]XP_043580818.1 uncharacterized protein LOC122566926 isoform X2 [Bombus pyrosoma]
MTQKGIERFLSVLYISSVITSMTSMICIATLWQYWTLILDVCISIDCGCILYSTNTFGTFAGGNGNLCKFAVYGLVPTALLNLCLAGYHGYRSYIKELNIPVRTYDDNSRDFGISDPSTARISSRQRQISYYKWMPFVFFAILLSCLSLSHAIIITDGFYKTCDHYRSMLIRILGSTGREAEVIHSRLSCGAIFDFMDYLEPNDTHWDRTKAPDSGIVLLLAIACTWYNFISWLIAFMLYYIMARSKFCFLEIPID